MHRIGKLLVLIILVLVLIASPALGLIPVAVIYGLLLLSIVLTVWIIKRRS